jgi:hypothetical protein
MSKTKIFENWHETRVGLFVMGMFELGLAYIFASWSLDSGSWLDYFFTVLFLIGSIYNFVNVIRKFRKPSTVLLKEQGKPSHAKRKTAKV